MAAAHEAIRVGEREVTLSNPEKVFFPEAGLTKRDLFLYYVEVADAALRGIARRPMLLKRYPDGVQGEPFFQKRAPATRPGWIEAVTMTFPSGRTADHVVVRDAAQLAWIVNLGCIDLNPHPVRTEDLEHPDELRIDLDPVPGVEWSQIVTVANLARQVLGDVGLEGWPKTSGSRGVHVYVRIEPRFEFEDVRRAALALARVVEAHAPTLATSRWWKEERHGVFLDYNQNAKDRTTASAYSVRPMPDARVSMPVTWEELAVCDPADFTLRTVPGILRERGDAHERIDATAGSLDVLLELAARLERDLGLEDAPWPPHHAKRASEPSRVAPSRKRGGGGSGRRTPTMPLLLISRARRKLDALAGLERWKQAHPQVAELLAPDDVLVDSMRGRSSTWTRIRVNLRHVPVELRPAAATPDPDLDPSEA
jgi:bifunctional non-homologous end joining protein LigD